MHQREVERRVGIEQRLTKRLEDGGLRDDCAGPCLIEPERQVRPRKQTQCETKRNRHDRRNTQRVQRNETAMR
jgi:hypothetical protein